MRSWLTSGAQMVDRRRRFGRHDRTRKLLVVDPQARPASAEGWQSTTAALQRHTVSGALNELEPEHRRVIRLAYLEGHTNRQIAAALGVSVTTAKRRLIKALERLEIYISAAGAWLAAVLIFVGARAARLNVSPDAQRVASTVTAGVLAGAAVGVVTFLPDTMPRAQHAAPVTAAAPLVPPALHPVASLSLPLHTTVPSSASFRTAKVDRAAPPPAVQGARASRVDDQDEDEDGARGDGSDSQGSDGQGHNGEGRNP